MRVGLVMIVRNEEAVIRRALVSAIPFVNTWLIVDTGSTDRTREIVRETLTGIPGDLVDRPWVDFGHNRTEALRLCEGRMDWAIMLDADDSLVGRPPPSSLWKQTRIDGISIRINHNNLWHDRVHIFRMGRGWMYRGAIHEVPVCEAAQEKPVLGLLPPETYMVSRCDGSRSKNPRKYLDDAAILEADLAKNPGDARTLYYLAQSYRDAGQVSEAVRYYARYLDCRDGSPQERYIAIISLIGIVTDRTTKLELAWRAIETCPQRVEAPYIILQTWRQQGVPVTPNVWALAKAVENRVPDMRWLLVNPALYEWEFDNEIAIAALERGCYREAYNASVRCAVWAPDEAIREVARQRARAAHACLTL
jgi:glycosyltransferase involved in cell wall biosynthesis